MSVKKSGKNEAKTDERSGIFYIEGSQFANYRFKVYDKSSETYRPLERFTLGRLLENAAVFDKQEDTLIGFIENVFLEPASGVLKLEVKIKSNGKGLKDSGRK